MREREREQSSTHWFSPETPRWAVAGSGEIQKSGIQSSSPHMHGNYLSNCLLVLREHISRKLEMEAQN